MPALIIYGLLALVVAAALVGLLIFVLPDDTLAPTVRDTVPIGLPPRSEIGADDVTRLRLPVTLRGYRMVDTDAVLDRLGAEIERRDREIAGLRLDLDARRTAEHSAATAHTGNTTAAAGNSAVLAGKALPHAGNTAGLAPISQPEAATVKPAAETSRPDVTTVEPAATTVGHASAPVGDPEPSGNPDRPSGPPRTVVVP